MTGEKFIGSSGKLFVSQNPKEKWVSKILIFSMTPYLLNKHGDYFIIKNLCFTDFLNPISSQTALSWKPQNLVPVLMLGVAF